MEYRNRWDFSRLCGQRAIRLAVAIVCLLFACAEHAQAAVVAATFVSTADNSQYGNGYVDNVSAGDLVIIRLYMDNGGGSLFNQTWNASQVLSVCFEFNNGAHKTVFGAGVNDDSGNGGIFATDHLGVLTAVPFNWTGSFPSTVLSTNSSQTPLFWYLNNGNDKYYTDVDADGYDDLSVGIPNPLATTFAANWTIASEVPAVPEPTSMAIFGIGALGLALRKRRKSKV